MHRYLESSVMLTYVLWRSLLSESLIVVSAVLKYFLSGLLGADTNALYTIFTIKHLLLSDHAALFLQLHPWLLEVRYSRQ